MCSLSHNGISLGIERLEIRFARLAQLGDGARQGLGALAALRPMGAQDRLAAAFLGRFADRRELGLAVAE